MNIKQWMQGADGQTEGQMGSVPALPPGQALGRRQGQYSYLQQVEGPSSRVDGEIHYGRTGRKELREKRGVLSRLAPTLPDAMGKEILRAREKATPTVHSAPRRGLYITSST